MKHDSARTHPGRDPGDRPDSGVHLTRKPVHERIATTASGRTVLAGDRSKRAVVLGKAAKRAQRKP